MELWLVLAALWLWECLAYLPPGGASIALLRKGPPRLYRRPGLWLTPPWPLRLTFTLDAFPVEVTPSAAIGAGPLSWLAATGAVREERAVPWSPRVVAAGAVVRMGDRPLVRASGEAAAERLASGLKRIASAAPAARVALANEQLRNALAPAGVAARIALVRRATLAHRALAALSIAGLGAGIPGLTFAAEIAWDSVWENTWPVWVGLHALGLAALAAAEIALGAPNRGARLLRALVYPPTQWRGSHELGSAALGDVHPLAALHALSAEQALIARARAALAECDHARVDASGAERAEERRAALRARRAEIEAVLDAMGLGPRVRAAPERRDGSASSYCPRCFGEFVAAGWVCTDCGIETRPFGSAG